MGNQRARVVPNLANRARVHTDTGAAVIAAAEVVEETVGVGDRSARRICQ